MSESALRCLVLLLAAVASDQGDEIKLCQEINIDSYRGSFVSLGDLNGDGQVDLLLSRMGPHTTPAYVVALDLAGRKLWELADASVDEVGIAGYAREPTCRGIASIYDVDGDGRAEVLTELWRDGKPIFCLVDGASGNVEREIPSPLDMSVRRPSGYRSSRPVPMVLIVRANGPDAPPILAFKYEASDTIPGHVFALSPALEPLWHLQTQPTGMGHIPTVADVDGDGREEIVLGETVVDHDGKILWQHDFGRHADFTTVADVAPSPGNEVLLSLCDGGRAFCLAADGSILWQKTGQEVPHGQAIWAGDFLDDQAGAEAILLSSGHVGDFLTVRASDGAPLARFQHRSGLRAYPDFPIVVDWQSRRVQSLWIPVDRRLVDGRGATVQDLGPYDARVSERLGCGTTKSQLAAQAFALDLCGDEREELVLYQPYHGRSVFIFTQPDSDARPKPYVHQPAAYNIRSYF